MEDKEEDVDVSNRKMKKKRRIDEDGLQDYSVTKRKKKKKNADKKENEAFVDSGNTKRKRKESEREDTEEEEAGTKRKKKKKKRKHEEEGKEYIASESPVPRKKMKKKKKKKEKIDDEEEEEEKALDSSYDNSFVAENRDRRGERAEEEVEHGNTQPTFLKPFPVQARKGGKRGKRKVDVENEGESRGEEKTEKSSSCRKKRKKDKEGRRREERGGDSDDEQGTENRTIRKTQTQTNRKPSEDENQEKENQDNTNQQDKSTRKTKLRNTLQHHNRETKQKETTKTRPPGITSRLAYSGIHGWETDTSTDDLDFSDDQYHVPSAVIRSRVRQARGRSEPPSTVLYSEGEEVEGFGMDGRYANNSDDSDEEDNSLPIEVTPDQRSSPGFIVKQRDIPLLEDVIYKFPPGVGVPPAEIEEVDDAENYWIVKENDLKPSTYAEEAKEYIDAKIECIEGYFHRLQYGQLTDKETKETRPENFDEPFYPTPRQLKFLDTLNIRITWRLSDLHKYHLHTLTLPHKSRAQWLDLKLFADTSRFSLREDKVIARNWFAFQKEYDFYDLRPLVSVRTARLVREGDHMTVQPYEYLSHANKVHFLLYLAKDLPTRTLRHVSRRILKLLPFLRGQCLLRQSQPVSGSLLAQLVYVMEVFGADMLAAELLLGRMLKSYYSRCFSTHVMLRDIKLRVGPWRKEEDKRFLKGLEKVLGVKTYEEAYRLRRIPWAAIFPYVRTRSITYMRRRLIVLTSRNGEMERPAVRKKLLAKFIRLLYEEQVDSFSHLDWEALARQVGTTNPIRLVWMFRKMYFAYVPYQHRDTVAEGLKYLYDHFLPAYEGPHPRRIPQPGDLDYEEHQRFDPSAPANADPSRDPSHDPGNHSSDSSDLSDPVNMNRVSEMVDDPDSDLTEAENQDLDVCSVTNGCSDPNSDMETRVKDNNSKKNHRNKENKVRGQVSGSDRILDTTGFKVKGNTHDQSHRKVTSTQQQGQWNTRKEQEKNTMTLTQSERHQSRGDLATSNDPKHINIFDLADVDADDDDSDADDFENETLSQAVLRS